MLRRIPTDGTFDQMRPLNRVPWLKSPIYSFDLSAATDRLPIGLQRSLLESAYGEEFANNWQTLLVGRDYKLPSFGELKNLKAKSIVGLPAGVSYTVGQPMGALSSWAMLAMTHHYILHYCA